MNARNNNAGVSRVAYVGGMALPCQSPFASSTATSLMRIGAIVCRANRVDLDEMIIIAWSIALFSATLTVKCCERTRTFISDCRTGWDRQVFGNVYYKGSRVASIHSEEVPLFWRSEPCYITQCIV